MTPRTLRTIGATVVLFGLAVAGILQIETVQPEPAEIAVDDVSTPIEDGASTTTQSEPFVHRIGVLSGVSTLNYWAYYGAEPTAWNSYILGPTKPALFSLEPGSGSIAPELATGEASPTWDDEGWRVRVHLSSDFRWSDGERVTADDFVFTFETVRGLGLKGSWAEAYPAEIESMHADSEHLLRIEFSNRPNLSVWPYGVGLAPVMAEHVWSDEVAEGDAEALYDATGADDVSGGPLVVAAASDGLIVSNANPGYPGSSAPDTVEYHVYPDEAAALAALADGEIDTVLTPKGLTAEQLGAVADPSVEVVSSPANGIRYLGFNLKRAPMSDQAFRTALALLVDRDGLAESIPQTGAAAWTMVPGANAQWFDPETAADNQERYTGDLVQRLDEALAALKTAGYAWQSEPAISDEGELVAGTGLTIGGIAPQPLTILTPGDAYDPARPEYVATIAATLDALGFDARPVETDFDSVVDLVFTSSEDGTFQYDMYLLGWTLGNPALPAYYRPFFAGNGAMNNTGYSSDAFAESLAAYEGAFTEEAAEAALQDMEEILAADLPYLPLYTSVITEAYRSDRVWYATDTGLGGIQARLGAIQSVRPKG